MIDLDKLKKLADGYRDAGAGKFCDEDCHLLSTAVPALIAKIQELEDHCKELCKCPSHGPSLIQVPDGEFDD